MSKAVGIDLGTTNSVVAILEGGEPTVIANSEGNRTTPSIVAFKGAEVLVGELAKRQAITNPDNTIRSIKREMGSKSLKKFEDKEFFGTIRKPYDLKSCCCFGFFTRLLRGQTSLISSGQLICTLLLALLSNLGKIAFNH